MTKLIRSGIWAFQCVLLILPQRCFATVAITAITGTFEHGQELVIAGTDFGTNTSFYLYEDIESGTFNPNWGSTGDLGINTANQRTRFSRYCAHLNFTSAAGHGFFSGPASPTSPVWYSSYWCMFSTNWDWGTTGYGGTNRFLANGKIGRWWNASTSIDENFLVSYLGPDDSLIYNMEYVAGPSANGTYIGNARALLSTGRWHHIQTELIENSSPGATNGQFRLWIDGVLLANKTNILTREDFSQFKRVSVVGFDSVWGPAADETDKRPNDYYIDDIVIYNGLPRLELCDSPSYEGGHREDQEVLFWSNSLIRIKVNQGSFLSGAKLYLFLTDANGRRSAGIPMTVGPRLDIRRTVNCIVLSWHDTSLKLQGSSRLGSAWMDVSSATFGSYTNCGFTGYRFYRLAE